jgi:hypothetical protein
MYEGFATDDTGLLGGVLDRWTDLYYGWFQFKDLNEIIHPLGYSPSGLFEGYDRSYLTELPHTLPPQVINT